MKPVSIVALAAALAFPPVSASPPRDAAWGAVDRVQDARHEAEKLGSGDPSPDSLREAEAILKDALAYLDTPDVRAWADGNLTLYFRRYDALRDLAAVYVAQGRREDALRALEMMQDVAYVPAIGPLLSDSKDFEALRDEPRFRKILETLRSTDRLWRVPNIATPYRDKLGVEERIAGLSLFWAEARQSFVYFDHVPDLDWDRTYLDFIRRVSAVQTTEQYYRELMQLAPMLRDGHTNIYPPKELADRFYSRPPIRTERIGGRVYVTRVASASLASRVHIGDEVVAIDGEAVDQYARLRVEPFVSSSTPQDRELRTYGYQLLSGDKDRAVTLDLASSEGGRHSEVVARAGYTDIAYPEPYQFRILPGNIAYFAFDDMEGSEGLEAFERAFPKILASKGLVIDLRLNGGGSTQVGMQVLSYLTPNPLKVARQRFRDDPGYARVSSPMVRWAPTVFANDVIIPRKEYFTGPVAVLIGPRTFSAAEDFVMSFDVAKRGLLVGSPTGGSTGQPLFFALPGGGSARICVKRDTYPDGREFVGKGINPDIAVSMTAKDLRGGNDPVLQRAVAELSQGR